jgi:hypothetical protein
MGNSTKDAANMPSTRGGGKKNKLIRIRIAESAIVALPTKAIQQTARVSFCRSSTGSTSIPFRIVTHGARSAHQRRDFALHWVGAGRQAGGDAVEIGFAFVL